MLLLSGKLFKYWSDKRPGLNLMYMKVFGRSLLTGMALFCVSGVSLNLSEKIVGGVARELLDASGIFLLLAAVFAVVSMAAFIYQFYRLGFFSRRIVITQTPNAVQLTPALGARLWFIAGAFVLINTTFVFWMSGAEAGWVSISVPVAVGFVSALLLILGAVGARRLFGGNELR